MAARASSLIRLLRRSLVEFLDDDCPQFAAAIAYRVLFSLFPLAILLSGIFSLVVRAVGVRADVVDAIVRNVPLDESGEAELQRLLEGATSGLSALGLLAVVGVVWAASGMMAAIRSALNRAWDVAEPRPFVRGKVVDVALVLAVGAVVLASFVLTVTTRTAAGVAVDLDSAWAGVATGVLVPLALSFAVTLLLYRVVPAADVALREAWRAALGVACGFVLLQTLFAQYVANFASYNAIYGSLGAVIAFMAFVYLAALLFLFGAEAAAELPRLRDGTEAEDGGGPPLPVQARQALRGLWVRERKREADRRETAGPGVRSD
jgi:membrane protein